jgi:hypothetical protein
VLDDGDVVDTFFRDEFEHREQAVGRRHGHDVSGRDLFDRCVVPRFLHEEVAARHDPGAATVVVEQRIHAVRSHFEATAGVSDRRIPRNRLDVPCHRLAHTVDLEHVGCVPTRDVHAAARELLGQHALVRQRVEHEVGEHRRQHQRKDRLIIAGELEREHD